MTIWEQVESLLAEGKGATITLTEAQEVKMPYRRRLGVPAKQKRRPEDPWAHYAGGISSSKRPRCMATGCHKHLRRNQPAACCPEHERAIVDDCMKMLAVLKYRLVERLDDYEEMEHGASIVSDVLEELKNGSPDTTGNAGHDDGHAEGGCGEAAA